MKKLLLVELNEFNSELLEAAARQLGLANLQKVVSWQKSKTNTEDRYDSGFLEPWSQWVSIHTGTKAKEHGINHLGDVPNLQSLQLWEELGEKGVTTGIWGVMNGSRRQAKNNLYFVADPWTFSEEAYPEHLNGFIGILKYAAKNYTSVSLWQGFKHGLSFLWIALTELSTASLFRGLWLFTKAFFKFGPKSFTVFMLFEYWSTCLFIKYKKQSNPQFNILFYNTVAHLQHHYWKEGTLKPTPEIACGFEWVDEMLGMVFDSLDEDEAVALFNGFSQKNTNDEKPWILYRQKDPHQFLVKLGLKFERVEQLMTHDAHIFFKTSEDREKAFQQLQAAKVQGLALFFVEKDKESDKKLFYRVDFFDEVTPETMFQFGGREFKMLDLFVPVVRRTGKHIPEGAIYFSEIDFPESLANHEIYQQVLKHFSN